MLSMVYAVYTIIIVLYIKNYVHDENMYYAPIFPLFPWYVTINPYIHLLWGVLWGYYGVAEGMCPIYGILQVI